MNEKWTKYSYVCTACDSLFEITVKDPKTYEPQCCGFVCQVSVSDATINTNNQEKEVPMNTTVEYVDTTILALQEAIAKKDEYITRLQDEISQKSNLVYTVRAEMQNFRNSAKEYVIEALNERQMTHEVAETLAQILDFELTKTVTVTATVDFEVEIEVPFDADADEIAETLDFSVDSYNYSIDDFQVDVQSLQASDNIS